MAVTVVVAWLTASQARRRRDAGFCRFLLSDVLWAAWGLHVQAYAFITLQVLPALLNIRGVHKNDPSTQPGKP